MAVCRRQDIVAVVGMVEEATGLHVGAMDHLGGVDTDPQGEAVMARLRGEVLVA